MIHMTGDALDHYCSIAERHPEAMPTTWEELREFITENYESVSAVSVIKQLRAVSYHGNVQDIIRKFNGILSQGEQPPEQFLIKTFLCRFPWELVKEADMMRFNSWTEARDFVEATHRARGIWAQEYYMEACEEFRRDMLKDKEVQIHGWLETEATDRDRQRKEGNGMAINRGDTRGRNGNLQFNVKRGSNKTSPEAAMQRPIRYKYLTFHSLLTRL